LTGKTASAWLTYR